LKAESSWFIRLMFLLNIIAIVSLCFSYLAAYITPASDFWWLQFFGLAYGILVIVNLFIILFWLLLKRKNAWYSLVAILIGANRLFQLFQPGTSIAENKLPKNSDYPVKVMSFNVRLFDLYNWSGNHEYRNKILSFLKSESPDIVCFQEYYSSEGTDYNFRMNDTLKSILPAVYSHIQYTSNLHDNKDHWGIATFSKYPIVNKKKVYYKKKGRDLFICTDVVIKNDTLRIINAHLESIRFKTQDYRFIENLGSDATEEELSTSINILKKIKWAYTRRARQIKVVKEEIDNSPHPVILCGDFNDTPASYSYHKLSDGLADAFRESGSGFGRTYAGNFPSFRIDYILHDKKFKSAGFTTHRVNLSDHYPISCLVYKE
jgi:endonuclease/exonuclease/phosphatase family metal-dependent hydrolase